MSPSSSGGPSMRLKGIVLGCLILLPCCGVAIPAAAKASANTREKGKPESRLKPDSFSGLAWRGIGPAATSGRVGDVAVHPRDRHVWYVAVASGGVWKTENAGTTWSPI